ncbi:hypothetical protein [Virgisporangium ochraceum]|nr:hypothetical protein [Virgisporangium ochraceum]
MQDQELRTVAGLLHERNVIDKKIAGIIERPMTAGHLGEWIAAKIFDIDLEQTATSKAFDGRFASGSLQGLTVNVKWYLKREGLIDVTESDGLDYYLVLAGPAAPAISSRGTVRPWCLNSVHLFDARQLLRELRERGVRIGTGTSVLAAQWAAAEIYPQQRSSALVVQPEQAALLRQFASAP